MKLFNKEQLAAYEYKPLVNDYAVRPNVFTIGDTVSISAESFPSLNSIPLQMAQPASSCSGCAVNPSPVNASGIEEMVHTMLKGADANLDDAAIAALTGDLDLSRLENIFHLSQQGDGWDDGAAKQVLQENIGEIMNPTISRRQAMQLIAGSMLAGFAMLQIGCATGVSAESDDKNLKWDEYFKGNYRLMTEDEKAATVNRLERLYEQQTGQTVNISAEGPIPGVLYGYAFNISKCRGYMDCVRGCLEENNQDRASDMRYIRIHEHEQGSMNFDEATDDFDHPVPNPGHYYIGTQCFHCEKAPCIPVCPVKATWKEDDGIVVVDYDWCIGCRYCIAACPYDARRFNWADPVVPQDQVNRTQHYLGNRLRKQGVTEKCTFCIQRTRKGKNPACVEACPTGARIFGNLLDPNSNIRWVLQNKKVFRLKEDLGTEPKFWYFMD